MVSRLTSRFFYGYTIVITASVILAVYSGGRGAFGVFFDPMASEFRWSAATMSIAYSIGILVDGGLGILMGQLTDKVGPRIVLTIAGCLIGLGYILISRVSTPWQMYLVYGVLLGAGNSGGFVPLITNLSRWFVARRSAMNGIVLSGMGVGQLIAPPVASWLISRYQWRMSYIIMGAVIGVTIVGAAQLLRKDPAQVGQTPYGSSGVFLPSAAVAARDYTFREALATGRFWLIFAVFVCLGFVSISMIVHIVPHTIHAGVPLATGAGVLATMGGFNIVGRLGLGSLADRRGNLTIYLLCGSVMGATIIWLIFAGITWQFFLFAAVFGFAQGGLGSVQAPLVVQYFGLKSHGSIFGAAGFGVMLGGTVGPIVMGYIFDVTGSYRLGFVLCAIMVFAGLSLGLLLRQTSKGFRAA